MERTVVIMKPIVPCSRCWAQGFWAFWWIDNFMNEPQNLLRFSATRSVLSYAFFSNIQRSLHGAPCTSHKHILNIIAPRLHLNTYLLFKNVCFPLSNSVLGNFFVPQLHGVSVASPGTDSPAHGCSCLEVIEQLKAQFCIRYLIHSLCFWQEQIQQTQVDLQRRFRPHRASLVLLYASKLQVLTDSFGSWSLRRWNEAALCWWWQVKSDMLLCVTQSTCQLCSLPG